MLLKHTADIKGLKKEIRDIFTALDHVHRNSIGVERECIITSGLDGKHGAKSLHYSGYAIDIRTRDLSRVVARALWGMIRIVLSRDYDVVLETDHIHIEYDPKGSCLGAENPC